MAFDLDRIVPWGRSLDEYRRMFALTEADLAGRMLDAGGGPASFVAEVVERGADAVAADPLYACAPDDIARRVDETHRVVVQQLAHNADDYVWGTSPETASPEALGAHRVRTMQRFLRDYSQHPARYVEASLPHLPFSEGAFDLAVCSHLLFLYDAHLDADFHVAALRDLLRVAREVRVFPLVNLAGRPSRHLKVVEDVLRADGWQVERVRVAYEFQRGGSTMLRLYPSA